LCYDAFIIQAPIDAEEFVIPAEDITPFSYPSPSDPLACVSPFQAAGGIESEIKVIRGQLRGRAGPPTFAI